jgi:hypothetical protein
MSRFAFEFTGRVARHAVGTWSYTVVYLPKEVATALPLKEYPRLRVRGEMDEYAFARAWQPTGETWFLMIPKEVLQRGGYGLGDWINVRFNIDDQEAVDVPEALAAALEEDAEFRAAWEGLTAGKRRSVVVRVEGAKTRATVAKRVAEVRELVVSGRLMVGKGKRRAEVGE